MDVKGGLIEIGPGMDEVVAEVRLQPGEGAVFEARLAALAEQVLHGGLLEALEPGLVGRQDDLPHGAVACSPPGIARALREALVELGRAAALLQLRHLVGEIGDGHLLNLGLDLPGPVLRAVEAPVLA